VRAIIRHDKDQFFITMGVYAASALFIGSMILLHAIVSMNVRF